MGQNVVKQEFTIGLKERNLLNEHKSLLIWLTGLSGSGKSTIANRTEQLLHSEKIRSFILDGDNVRTGLNKDLGFTEKDRSENIRRIAEVSKLLVDAGVVVIASFISPLISDREMVQKIVGSENFIEIFVHTSLEECENRDVKGLYQRARKGEIQNFTGITAPYEEPINPDLKLETEKETADQCAARIIDFIKPKLTIK